MININPSFFHDLFKVAIRNAISDIKENRIKNNVFGKVCPFKADHDFKKITKPMMGFKAFHSAQATIAGIEAAHMIRKGQLSEENMPAYKQFMALAG
jgi:transposase-like protein